MQNIDKELIDWAKEEIITKYKEDVALLIGQVGACKIPSDEQKIAFDYYIPSTERGYQLAQTFVIEDMGYDLYPMSWERLEGIAAFHEPQMMFAFEKGEVLYAREEADSRRFYELKEKMHQNLKNPALTFEKALEFLSTAMEIFQTMLFEESLCKVRKAAGGITSYLMSAVAMANETFLKEGYGCTKLTSEMERMQTLPTGIREDYLFILQAKTVPEIQKICYRMLQNTRDYFVDRKPKEEKEESIVNFEDLADWYQEARYTFRRIAYYAKEKAVEPCYQLGCYIQIEFDAIQKEFDLPALDLMGVFDAENLEQFAGKAKELEDLIVSILQKNQIRMKVYSDLQEFLKAQI